MNYLVFIPYYNIHPIIIILPSKFNDTYIKCITVVPVPDPCKDSFMNYCHKEATCNITASGFLCECRHGYNDVSIDTSHAPGESCECEYLP